MPMTYQQNISDYLHYLSFQKRYSPHTIISYQTDLHNFFDYAVKQYEILILEDIQTSFVRSWLASLKEAKMESRSINRKISALRSFYKYQLKKGIVTVSPLATIHAAKIKKRLPQFVAEKDIKLLFEHVEFAQNWNGKTDRLICTLLYNTGMRKAELIAIQESDVDMGNCYLKILGKGGKERLVPLSNEMIKIIEQYIKDKLTAIKMPDRKFLLVNSKGLKLYPKYVYNTVHKYLAVVTTIDKKSPHIFRHSFATHLMNNGADINAVKELLGHSSLAATQVYTHNTIEKLKEVHKKAHPKA